MIKFLVIAACSVLFWWGGFSWHNARRFIMPSVLTAYCFWVTHDLWALTMLASMGFLTLGYGTKSPLRHIFGDGWARGIWGLLVALALSLGLVLTGHLVWYFFVPYLAMNFTFENALKKIPQVIGDPIIGASLASLVLVLS